jgi:hypothetical protein
LEAELAFCWFPVEFDDNLLDCFVAVLREWTLFRRFVVVVENVPLPLMDDAVELAEDELEFEEEMNPVKEIVV